MLKAINHGIQKKSMWSRTSRQGDPPISRYGSGHLCGGDGWLQNVGAGLGNGNGFYPFNLIQYWK